MPRSYKKGGRGRGKSSDREPDVEHEAPTQPAQEAEEPASPDVASPTSPATPPSSPAQTVTRPPVVHTAPTETDESVNGRLAAAGDPLRSPKAEAHHHHDHYVPDPPDGSAVEVNGGDNGRHVKISPVAKEAPNGLMTDDAAISATLAAAGDPRRSPTQEAHHHHDHYVPDPDPKSDAPASCGASADGERHVQFSTSGSPSSPSARPDGPAHSALKEPEVVNHRLAAAGNPRRSPTQEAHHHHDHYVPDSAPGAATATNGDGEKHVKISPVAAEPDAPGAAASPTSTVNPRLAAAGDPRRSPTQEAHHHHDHYVPDPASDDAVAPGSPSAPLARTTSSASEKHVSIVAAADTPIVPLHSPAVRPEPKRRSDADEREAATPARLQGGGRGAAAWIVDVGVAVGVAAFIASCS